MSDEDSKATLQPMLSARDQNDDLAGASILTLLQRSAHMAAGNSQYAVGIAKDLSARLIASEAKVAELTDRVAELEVDVQVYRNDLSRRKSGSTRFPLNSKERLRESPSEPEATPVSIPKWKRCPIFTPAALTSREVQDRRFISALPLEASPHFQTDGSICLDCPGAYRSHF
jgi:hypothetical protein